MSTIERVNQWSHRIFNTTANEKNVRRSSNPFAKSNFQKNILMEDVFESSAKKNVNFTGDITHVTKRIYSTFVGSINDFGKRFYEGIESIKEFGLRMKDGIVSAWNKVCEIGNTELHPVEDLKSGYSVVKDFLATDMGKLINTREKEIAKMAKMDPQTQIKPMFLVSLKALEEEVAKAA